MKRDKRLHGVEAAGGGDAGRLDTDGITRIGPCPSCGAVLRSGPIKHPVSGRVMEGLVHPIPFCTYFGDTDPTEIMRRVARENQA